MRYSRGMGAISKEKVRAIKKRDGNEPVKVFKAGGRVKKFAKGGNPYLFDPKEILLDVGDMFFGGEDPNPPGTPVEERDEGIEPVYPLENIALGRAATKAAELGYKGLKSIGNAAVKYGRKKIDLLRRPKVDNYLVKDIFGKGAGETTYGVRNVFRPEELEDIKNSGYMLPSPKEVASGRNRKWFTETTTPKKQTLRVKKENIPKNRAVRREHVERYNAETGEYEPLKKGGKVVKKNWIAGAIKKPGALRASLGVKGDKPIPAKKLAKAAKAPGKLGQRARLAQTLKKFEEGGHVNEAGNYTKPGLRKKIVSQVKAAATHGTKAGQWSARKAQLVAKKYKDAGGGYTD